MNTNNTNDDKTKKIKVNDTNSTIKEIDLNKRIDINNPYNKTLEDKIQTYISDNMLDMISYRRHLNNVGNLKIANVIRDNLDSKSLFLKSKRLLFIEKYQDEIKSEIMKRAELKYIYDQVQLKSKNKPSVIYLNNAQSYFYIKYKDMFDIASLKDEQFALDFAKEIEEAMKFSTDEELLNHFTLDNNMYVYVEKFKNVKSQIDQKLKNLDKRHNSEKLKLQEDQIQMCREAIKIIKDLNKNLKFALDGTLYDSYHFEINKYFNSCEQITRALNDKLTNFTKQVATILSTNSEYFEIDEIDFKEIIENVNKRFNIKESPYQSVSDDALLYLPYYLPMISNFYQYYYYPFKKSWIMNHVPDPNKKSIYDIILPPPILNIFKTYPLKDINLEKLLRIFNHRSIVYLDKTSHEHFVSNEKNNYQKDEKLKPENSATHQSPNTSRDSQFQKNSINLEDPTHKFDSIDKVISQFVLNDLMDNIKSTNTNDFNVNMDYESL